MMRPQSTELNRVFTVRVEPNVHSLKRTQQKLFSKFSPSPPLPPPAAAAAVALRCDRPGEERALRACRAQLDERPPSREHTLRTGARTACCTRVGGVRTPAASPARAGRTAGRPSCAQHAALVLHACGRRAPPVRRFRGEDAVSVFEF
ncbi:hypothetical protein F511_22372 [Dorcoceras hygrometricum]|uniref:Uncharacterized protein n=1 Tax=Dorcoceras hygrometricum TaxID=472368 RepID=A0A2Z7D3Y3_9LAMI|nr:hypothetical protein F511_22372 [Dorcoceras hygrometricum]